MESARHPFPVSSTVPHYRRTKSESQEKLWAVQNLHPQSFVLSSLVSSEVTGTISTSSVSRSAAAETKPMRARTPNPGCGGRCIRYTRSPGRGQARSGQPGGRRSPLRPRSNPYGPLPRCTSRKATRPRSAQGSANSHHGSPFLRSVCCSYSSVSVVSIAAAGMISASSPSISRNCLAVTKPMVRPAFLVSRTQAICSISRLLGRCLSS